MRLELLLAEIVSTIAFVNFQLSIETSRRISDIAKIDDETVLLFQRLHRFLEILPEVVQCLSVDHFYLPLAYINIITYFE